MGQGNVPHAQHRLREQLRHQAHDAQRLQEGLVNNMKELEVLMMQNKTYCAEIARGVSAKNRKPWWRELRSWPSELQTPTPGSALRRTNKCPVHDCNLSPT